MDPGLNTPIPSPRSYSGEMWAIIAGAIGSALVLLKKALNAKGAPKTDLVTRVDLCAEMLATRERIYAAHLAVLDKLDVIHLELLGALERQSSRLSAVESGLARVDERTRR